MKFFIFFQAVENFYRLQRSWGKVIFSHAFVILSTGGSTWAGTTPKTRYTPQTRCPPGTRYTPQTRYTPPGPGTPPGVVHAGRYGQQVGGTHPTGMHSCESCFYRILPMTIACLLQQNFFLKVDFCSVLAGTLPSYG